MVAYCRMAEVNNGPVSRCCIAKISRTAKVNRRRTLNEDICRVSSDSVVASSM